MEYASELRIKTTHYILSGFSIVVALAWNEFVKNVINIVYPQNSEHILAKLLYCIIITFMLIMIIKYLPDTSKELPQKVQNTIENYISRPIFC